MANLLIKPNNSKPLVLTEEEYKMLKDCLFFCVDCCCPSLTAKAVKLIEMFRKSDVCKPLPTTPKILRIPTLTGKKEVYYDPSAKR